MTIRQRLAAVQLAEAKAAIVRARGARSYTPETKATIESTVRTRMDTLMRDGRRFDSSAILDDVIKVTNQRLLAEARDHSRTAHQIVTALRPAFDGVRREARRPAPLPPVVSEQEARSMMSLERSAVEPLRQLLREVRKSNYHAEYGALDVAQQLEVLEQATRDQDLELQHFLEPRIERALRTPPAAIPGDIDAYTAAKTTYDAHVARLEQLREARLTDEDRQALAEVDAAVAAIEREWRAEAGVHDAVQHVRRIVPNDINAVEPVVV